ncbi:MAG TPA: ABC transporter permease, partial [Cyclobacteriaceae bacterium]|nr:ABC transporter permease [Cyclobacteriaceae bacterium]
MFRNYLKIAFRNLVRDRFYSFLNITGLSVGIAAAMLIILYIADEISYDHFLKDKERIYRVATMGKFGDQNMMNVAVSPAPLAEGFRNSIPEVENTVRLNRTQLIVHHHGETLKEEMVFFADSTFFDIFSFGLLQGDPHTVLTEPNSLVVTRETAIKYFGRDSVENGKALGELIRSGKNAYKITGITADIPYNSHLDFDLLISMSTNPDALNPIWISMNYYTYIKLRPGTDIRALDDKFRDIIIKNVVPQVVQYLHMPESIFSRENMDEQLRYYLQPVSEIHLHSNLYAEMHPNGNILYIRIFGVIAIFIILIACINFINLATARSMRRAKEVGVRKT